jgi:hypothetical protein
MSFILESDIKLLFQIQLLSYFISLILRMSTQLISFICFRITNRDLSIHFYVFSLLLEYELLYFLCAHFDFMATVVSTMT